LALARRGWNDAVESSVIAARDNSNNDGINALFIVGDMRYLCDAGIGQNFSIKETRKWYLQIVEIGMLWSPRVAVCVVYCLIAIPHGNCD
jgi:hypothetical protein